LAEGNSSLGAGAKVTVAGCSPYLSLPTSTCNAIAQHLPVTYNNALGLYTWNTEDPQYSRIISSASALQFTIVGMTNTEKLNISIPFRHLNLTLDAPLVDKPTPYFPCYTGHGGGYVLGRTFLQDAFIGANWLTQTWWLAQAPGPNIPAEPNVGTIKYGDTTIAAGGNDWKESWTGSWTALASDVTGNSTTSGSGNSTSSGSGSSGSSSDSNSGLSTGAKAGIGAGVGVVGLAALAGLVFLLRRRKKSPDNTAAIAHAATQQDDTKHGIQSPQTLKSAEYDTNMTMHFQQGHPEVYGEWVPQQHYTAELSGRPTDQMHELPAQHEQTFNSRASEIYTHTPTEGSYRY
jgi:hypothetical protein